MFLKQILTRSACVAALAGAMLVAGCGGSVAVTPSATATTAPTAIPKQRTVPAPAAGFTTYKRTDGTFGLNIPTGWQQTTLSSSSITITKFTNGKDIIIVAPLTLQLPVVEYPSLLQSVSTLLGGTNARIDATPKQEIIGANTWNTVSGSMLYKGVSYDAAAFGADHGAKTTFFIALTPHASSAADYTTYIVPMIQSFTFLT